jgi:hypothetical protein
MKAVNPLLLLIKGLLLFIIMNFVFATWNPAVGKWSLYNWLVPGRLRFPYGQGANDHNLTVDDLDAMFASHEVSAVHKEDEIRVFFVGDSSIWGDYLTPEETLSEQVNGLDLTCDEKKIHVYNLGYPHTFLLKDLLILYHAMQYEPDIVFWFVTTDSFLRKAPLSVLTANAEESIQLISNYGVDYGIKKIAKYRENFWDKTLLGQRENLARIIKLQLLGFVWEMTALDQSNSPIKFAATNRVVSDDFTYRGMIPPYDLSKRLVVRLLDSGAEVTDQIPLVIVNEPIMVATQGRKDVRYNEFYPRWAYDQYREILKARARENRWYYLDFWDSIPEENFTDTPLHLNPEGEALLANIMKPEILEYACGTE